jgi:predicted AlkP superfamily phosphohydrolase/phosphomutase
MSIAAGITACSSEKDPLKELVERTKPTNLKILIVGIDGATFTVMDSLMAEGKLPVARRLIEGGARAVLESDPPMSSPAIWTSVVTGRSRVDHGVEGFIVMTPDSANPMRLSNSNDRDMAALWNWVGPFGKTVGFNGWWASWPAEPVNGWMISDRLTRSLWGEWQNERQTEYLTYPDELVADLFDMILDPMRPPIERIKEYERFALHMLGQGQPDLTGLFLIALDPISHTFWHLYEPEAFEGVDPEEARRLGEAIPNLYEHNDRFLGEVLEHIDENTVVIVLSDHGFQATGELPRAVPANEFAALQSEAVQKGTVAVGQSGDHHVDGILIVNGPGIKRGATANAHIFDIAPTILALMGLPVEEYTDGRVLTEIIEPEFLEAHPLTTIRSYSDYFDREKLAITSDPNREELLERLRSLGYIQ